MHEISGRLGPTARRLLEYWMSLPMRGLVPDRSSFDPMAIAPILPFISLLERRDDGKWRFRLAGTEIERRWGLRFAGESYLDIDVISARTADVLGQEFRQVVEWPCGSWSLRSVAFRSGLSARIETVRLPMRANDGSVSLIVSASCEFCDRRAQDEDLPREIIRITEQRFLDIGGGVPAADVRTGT